MNENNQSYLLWLTLLTVNTYLGMFMPQRELTKSLPVYELLFRVRAHTHTVSVSVEEGFDVREIN